MEKGCTSQINLQSEKIQVNGRVPLEREKGHLAEHFVHSKLDFKG